MHMAGTNKALGQHWLNNRAILNEIADLAAGLDTSGAADLADDVGASGSSEKTGVEVCVEIGPGLGTLTSSLLKRFDKVVAVEYDKRLAENLPGSFPGKNLEVVQGDILDFDFGEITWPYVVAGNIPYYITSPIIQKLLTTSNPPERIVLLIQKEVAERITSDKETQLSLFVKNRAKVEEGPVVPKGEFTPPPKVDSQVVIMEPHEAEVPEEVFGLIRMGFRAPRKKLIGNLTGLKSREELAGIFADLGISADVRPGDLHLEDYRRLAEAVGKNVSKPRFSG